MRPLFLFLFSGDVPHRLVRAWLSVRAIVRKRVDDIKRRRNRLIAGPEPFYNIFCCVCSFVSYEVFLLLFLFCFVGITQRWRPYS